jgi:hypothetical protein
VALATKVKIEKWDYKKLKKLPHRKENNRLRDHLHNGIKIFVNYSFSKELISRIYKELKKLNTKKQKQIKSSLEPKAKRNPFKNP